MNMADNLKPGAVFVGIVNKSGKAEVEGNGAWKSMTPAQQKAALKGAVK
jgi:hypothetical protein